MKSCRKKHPEWCLTHSERPVGIGMSPSSGLGPRKNSEEKQGRAARGSRGVTLGEEEHTARAWPEALELIQCKANETT